LQVGDCKVKPVINNGLLE